MTDKSPLPLVLSLRTSVVTRSVLFCKQSELFANQTVWGIKSVAILCNAGETKSVWTAKSPLCKHLRLLRSSQWQENVDCAHFYYLSLRTCFNLSLRTSVVKQSKLVEQHEHWRWQITEIPCVEEQARCMFKDHIPVCKHLRLLRSSQWQEHRLSHRIQ